ncbi:unnamed protein product, partial [Dicrocoelium dendriticum]
MIKGLESRALIKVMVRCARDTRGRASLSLRHCSSGCQGSYAIATALRSFCRVGSFSPSNDFIRVHSLSSNSLSHVTNKL